MSLENFISNSETVKSLNDWLNAYFLYKSKIEKPYVILYGDTGNGKSYLVEQLAIEHKLDLLTFTFDDFEDTDIIEKSLNLQSIHSQNKKLILFDNIQDIKNKRRLYKLHQTSNFPIIFIVDSLKKLDEDFISNGLVLKMKRPMNFELRKILEQKVSELNIECKNLYDISEKCNSVRTALQSLLLDCVIEKYPIKDSNYKLVKLMSKRALAEDISWFVLLDAFKNIKQVNVKSFKLMNEFAFWDYVVHYEHFKNKDMLLDKIFFNNMQNIELVEPVWEQRKKKNNKKPKVEKPVVKEIEQTKQQSIGSFF